MENVLRVLLRGGWLLAVILILAQLIYQLPASPKNDAVVFVVLWALIVPLLPLPAGERKWEHLGRGLIGAMVVWVLSAVKAKTLGQQPHTIMALLTVGILAMALAGWLLQSRDDRTRAHG